MTRGVEIPATTVTPAAVTVTNATSVPVNSASQALTDVVNITSATFDSLTRASSVNAASSDLSVPAPAMTNTTSPPEANACSRLAN